MSCLDLETLLVNVKKTKEHKSFVQKYGKEQKAIDFDVAIKNLNAKYDTSYYLEKENRSFAICGHREHGNISRRSGILGETVTMTLGSKELEKAGHENTIKMIVDDSNNYIVVSLTSMKNTGMLDDVTLSKHRGVVRNDSGRFFYSWSLDELFENGTILYHNINNNNN